MGEMPTLPADPWQWPDLTSEEFQSLGSIGNGPTAPIFQYVAVRNCNAQRESIEKGDGFAVLACVRKCGTHGLVMPEWLVSAFNRRYDVVLNCRAKSWDDPKAFGAPYPKSANLAALRKRRIGRFQMHNAVCDAVAKGRKIDKETYEALGKPFGYGSTLAYELYREAVQLHGLHDPIGIRAQDRKAEKARASKVRKAQSATKKIEANARSGATSSVNSSKTASVKKQAK